MSQYLYCKAHASVSCGCIRRAEEESRQRAREAAEAASAAMLDMFQTPITPPSNGAPTSDEAAASLSEQAINEGHRRVLNALWKVDAGLTDEELVQVTGLNPSTLRPRRGECVERGLVEDSGETRPTRSGRKAVVWRLSERAVRLAERRKERAA